MEKVNGIGGLFFRARDLLPSQFGKATGGDHELATLNEADSSSWDWFQQPSLCTNRLG
jgi:hypothetical protein